MICLNLFTPPLQRLSVKRNVCLHNKVLLLQVERSKMYVQSMLAEVICSLKMLSLITYNSMHNFHIVQKMPLIYIDPNTFRICLFFIHVKRSCLYFNKKSRNKFFSLLL